MKLIQYYSHDGEQLGLFLFPDSEAGTAEKYFEAAEQSAKELEMYNPDGDIFDEVVDYLAGEGIERTYIDQQFTSSYL